MERHMVSLFLVRDEQVLLLYREGGTVVNHLWVAACGGHMEKDELNNAKAAVIREMREEIGLLESDVGEMPEGKFARIITFLPGWKQTAPFRPTKGG